MPKPKKKFDSVLASFADTGLWGEELNDSTTSYNTPPEKISYRNVIKLSDVIDHAAFKKYPQLANIPVIFSQGHVIPSKLADATGMYTTDLNRSYLEQADADLMTEEQKKKLVVFDKQKGIIIDGFNMVKEVKNRNISFDEILKEVLGHELRHAMDELDGVPPNEYRAEMSEVRRRLSAKERKSNPPERGYIDSKYLTKILKQANEIDSRGNIMEDMFGKIPKKQDISPKITLDDLISEL